MVREKHRVEIFAVKMMRAFNDPIIAYEPENIPGPESMFRQVVPLERLKLVLESDDTERVELASWAETAIYCSSASLVNQAWARGSAGKVYRYAFKQVMETWDGDGMDEQLEEELRFDRLELTDQEKRKVGKLRREIKRMRDQQFLEEQYDELGLDAPKAVWKSGPTVGRVADAD